MDWYPHNIGDYEADTLHLTAAEDGAYRRLVDWYYKNERPLPDDDHALAAIARIDSMQFKAMAATIRAFFVARNGLLQHKRCNKVIAEQTGKRRDWKQRKEKQRKNGLGGGAGRPRGVTRASRGTPSGHSRDTNGTPACVSTPEERRGEEVVRRSEEESQNLVGSTEPAPTATVSEISFLRRA